MLTLARRKCVLLKPQATYFRGINFPTLTVHSITYTRLLFPCFSCVPELSAMSSREVQSSQLELSENDSKEVITRNATATQSTSDGLNMTASHNNNTNLSDNVDDVRPKVYHTGWRLHMLTAGYVEAFIPLRLSSVTCHPFSSRMRIGLNKQHLCEPPSLDLGDPPSSALLSCPSSTLLMASTSLVGS